MTEILEFMRKMKTEEEKDRTVHVACDILRTLLVLGGSGWEGELMDGLAGLAAVRDDLGSVASPRETENALNLLTEKGLVKYSKGERYDAFGTSTVEDKLYTLEDYTATMQIFGADRSVVLLRRGEQTR